MACAFSARRTLLALAVWAAFAPLPVEATNLTWDGGGTDNNWGTINNWNPNQLPVNGDGLFFAGTLRTSASNNLSGLVLDRLTFNAGAAAFTLSGNALVISPNTPGSGGYIQNSSSNLQTINNALTFNTSAGGINPLTGSNAAITFNGAITLNGGVVSANGDSTLTFNGAISGTGSASGLAFDALAPLVLLNAQNTYTGQTRVFTGATLRLGASNRIPDGSNVNMQGGTLDLNGFTDIVGGLENSGTILLGSGNLQVNTVLNQLFVGTIGGSGKFTKSGTGALTLSGSGVNTYTGGTEVLQGLLTVSQFSTNALPDTGAVLVQGGTLIIDTLTETVGAVTLNGGALSGSGALQGTSYDLRSGSVSVRLTGAGASLTKTTSGTATLNSVNSYGGATTVADGTLALAKPGALPATTDVFISGAATLDLGTSAQTIDTLTLTDGTVSGSGATLTSNGVTAQNGTIGVGLAGSGGLLKQGAGSVTLNAASTYAGSTIVDAGILSLNGTGFLPAGSALSIGPSGLLRLNGFGQTVASLTGPGAIELGAGTLSVGGSGNFSGVISGTGGLVRQGTGTLLLSGTNTYTGQTLVSGGTLQLGNNALADSSSVRVDGGTLDIGDRSDLVRVVTLASGTIQGTTGVLQASTAFSAESGTIGARLGGAAGLTKLTSGTVTLSNSSAYTGVTNVMAGTLRLGNGGALPPTTALTVASGAVFDVNGTSTEIGSLAGAGTVLLGSGGALGAGRNGLSTTFSGTLSGTVGLTLGSGFFKEGTGTLIFSGQFQHDGLISVDGGTLQLPNGVPTPGQRLILVADGATLAAAGFVNRGINSSSAATITALGDLIIGDFTGALASSIQGTLNVGAHVVQLVNNAPVSIGGSALLAPGGRLTSFNQGTGITLAPGGRISASGNAFVDGNLLNRGVVGGPSAAGAFLTLSDDVSGDGSYTGNVRFAGNFSGGLSPARISMQNAVFDASSTLIMELAGLTPGTQYDQLAASGALELHGSLLVTLLNGFTPHAGDTFDLLDWGTLSGTFGSISLPSLASGLSWDTASLYTTGEIGVLAAIPEPEIYASLIAGLLGLLARRRRRRIEK